MYVDLVWYRCSDALFGMMAQQKSRQMMCAQGSWSLKHVVQSDKFGWVGLGSLTDRRKSVGTEDGGGNSDNDI